MWFGVFGPSIAGIFFFLIVDGFFDSRYFMYFQSLRYGSRPSTGDPRRPQPTLEKEEQPDEGGCNHASEQLVGGTFSMF